MKAAFLLICLLVEVEAPEFDRVVAVEVFGQYKTVIGMVCKVDAINQKIILWNSEAGAAYGKSGNNRAETVIPAADIVAIDSPFQVLQT